MKMLKEIECRIVDSRPLEPCRAISHRQPDNCRRDFYSKPPRPDFRAKTETNKPGFSSGGLKELIPVQKTYPLGLIMDILA
jgi:hypothetical protein